MAAGSVSASHLKWGSEEMSGPLSTIAFAAARNIPRYVFVMSCVEAAGGGGDSLGLSEEVLHYVYDDLPE